MVEHYDMNGERMELEEWLAAIESPKCLLQQEWVLGRDKLRAWVSTVWLGIDHNHMSMFRRGTPEFERLQEIAPYEMGVLAALDEEGELRTIDTRPWIFETMAFEGVAHGNRVHAVVGDELWQERSATREEALNCHFELCARIRRGEAP